MNIERHDKGTRERTKIINSTREKGRKQDFFLPEKKSVFTFSSTEKKLTHDQMSGRK